MCLAAWAAAAAAAGPDAVAGTAKDGNSCKSLPGPDDFRDVIKPALDFYVLHMTRIIRFIGWVDLIINNISNHT